MAIHKCGHNINVISFLEEYPFEMTVCFSQKDVDTLFPLSSLRKSGVECMCVWHALLHFRHL